MKHVFQTAASSKDPPLINNVVHYDFPRHDVTAEIDENFVQSRHGSQTEFQFADL